MHTEQCSQTDDSFVPITGDAVTHPTARKTRPVPEPQMGNQGEWRRLTGRNLDSRGAAARRNTGGRPGPADTRRIGGLGSPADHRNTRDQRSS